LLAKVIASPSIQFHKDLVAVGLFYRLCQTLLHLLLPCQRLRLSPVKRSIIDCRHGITCWQVAVKSMIEQIEFDIGNP